MKMTTHYDRERESVICTEVESGLEIVFNKNYFSISEILRETDLIIGDTDECRQCISDLYDSL